MYKLIAGSFLFLCLNAFANNGAVMKQSCYMAKNPNKAEINFVSEDGETRITEKAKLVEVKLQTVKYEGMDSAQDEILVKAKSNLLAFNTSAIHFSGIDKGEYAIECDGGRVKLSKDNGQLVANSDYLVGEVTLKSSEEGCNGLGSVSMKNLVLEPLACE